jgi:hypothetical protein
VSTKANKICLNNLGVFLSIYHKTEFNNNCVLDVKDALKKITDNCLAVLMSLHYARRSHFRPNLTFFASRGLWIPQDYYWREPNLKKHLYNTYNKWFNFFQPVTIASSRPKRNKHRGKLKINTKQSEAITIKTVLLDQWSKILQ